MKNKPLSVMIVEDEIMLQDVYKLVLESGGHKVSTANNGREALEKVSAIKPDIILLDMHMPVMDGREFMHKFNCKDFPRTRVIVYSNLSDKLVEAEVLELGAVKFVLKSSMTPADLLSMVSKLA